MILLVLCPAQKCDGCEPDRHAFIARYGNENSEYMSNALLISSELSHLDLVALFNGLELTVEENERLLKRLAEMYRGKLSVRDYRKMSTTPELSFAEINHLGEHILHYSGIEKKDAFDVDNAATDIATTATQIAELARAARDKTRIP